MRSRSIVCSIDGQSFQKISINLGLTICHSKVKIESKSNGLKNLDK